MNLGYREFLSGELRSGCEKTGDLLLNCFRVMEINKTLGRYISKRMNQHHFRSDCPSLRTLSEFMDGKLKSGERVRIISYLNSCQDCYQSVSEAVFIQEELEANQVSLSTAGARHYQSFVIVIKERLYSHINYAFSVTALVVVLLVVVWMAIPYHPPGFSSMMTSLTKSTNIDQLNRTLIFPDTSRHNYGFHNGLSLERAVFRLGILLCDLEVAIKVHDKTRSLNQLDQILSLVLSIKDAESLVQSFNKIQLRIKNVDFPDSIVGNAEQLETLLAEREVVFFLNFGQWLQSLKLAASLQKADFFDSRVAEYYYESALKRQIPRGVIDSLQKILMLSKAGIENENDFYRIEQTVNEIYRILL